MTSLATELPKAIDRVRAIQDGFKELRGLPNVMVEPQIAVMESDIRRGIAASAAGDTVEMLRAYEALKGWQ